ncbi:ABC-three component system protein [Paenibacillus pedocola]|uniref:ABC-three component system protein n=1 Tax=Paenibacillus pedocola TaxID=3242193 RepID=UPI002877AC3C|nr:ABC-three component system protein [Paenibacillus typhae]
MIEIEKDTVDIAEPVVSVKLSNTDLLLGKVIEPIKRLQVISDKDFEDLVREWSCGYLKNKYVKVRRCGAAGDMGRDVIAYVSYDKKNDLIWDNYQCKHYNAPLAPSSIWIELGKLCYYSFIKEYSIPRKYYFVTPNGVSTKLSNLIDSPNKLKEGLIKEWNDKCQNHIITGKKIDLVGDFLSYVEGFDFSIFDDIDPQELIEQHSKTKYFFYRFGGIHKTRPEPVEPPEKVTTTELLYVKKLLEAYSDNHKSKINDILQLPNHSNYFNHFNRQRKCFYSAESLMLFERDTLPPGVNAYEDLKQEVYDGVIDIIESKHDDGFERVKAVCKAARSINVPSYPLYTSVKGNDLNGLCHHLANEDKIISWVD